MNEQTIDLRDTIVKEPNRGARLAILAGFALATPLLTTPLAVWLGQQFFSGNDIVWKVSAAVGFFAAIPIVGIAAEKYFLIRNITTGMFLTQDTLRSLLGKKDINVAYGAGTHICFPWERRLAGNNILIEDAPVEFRFEVQRPDGSVFGKGSYRMRPDPENPVAFLSSAASVGAEIKDLVIAEIQEFFKDQRAMDATGMVGALNAHLKSIFIDARSEAEARNGVCISDATVVELVTSDDLKKTAAGISEARAVQEGVLILLGMATQADFNAALKSGLVTQDDARKARENFLAISGNMDNLQIKRSEYDFNIRGLSQEAIDAVIKLAQTPAAQAAATAAAARSSKK